MTIINVVTEILDENRKAYQAQRAKVEKRAYELNAGWASTRFGREFFDKIVEPTWGVDERPHAPFDGYLWEHPVTKEVMEYAGGQYLPFVSEVEQFDKPEYTGDHGWWKLRLTYKMFCDLQGLGFPIEIRSPYKTWEVGSTQVCMCQVRAAKAVLVAIQEHSEQVFKDLYADMNKDKGVAPTGKVVVTGKIQSVKTFDDFYGPVSKMLVVLENGATVYGSLPKAIPIDHRGMISFSATFEHAKDDNTHAFFKRPTKAEVL